MGKCKKRTIHKTNNSYYITREEAISNIYKILNTKTSPNYSTALDLISLFGISAEELSEAGLSYENLKALGSSIN